MQLQDTAPQAQRGCVAYGQAGEATAQWQAGGEVLFLGSGQVGFVAGYRRKELKQCRQHGTRRSRWLTFLLIFESRFWQDKSLQPAAGEPIGIFITST